MPPDVIHDADDTPVLRARTDVRVVGFRLRALAVDRADPVVTVQTS